MSLKAFLSTILVLASFKTAAGVIGTDDRQYLVGTGVATSLGLSADEVHQIMNSTGAVYCPGTKYGNPILTSGALVGSDFTVMTVAHAFVDEHGRKREPLSECYFQTQGVKAERRGFEFSASSPEFVTKWSEYGNANDYAVVKIKSLIPGARGFPVKSLDFLSDTGLSFLVVSAQQQRLNAPFYGGYTLIQACTIRSFPSRGMKYGTIYNGDCDQSPGGSGSVNLVRLGGVLTAIGISEGAGQPLVDGPEFSLEKGFYSFHIGITDGFLALLNQVIWGY